MFSLISLNILKCLLLFSSAEAVFSECSNFRWIETDDNNYIWSIIGEWRVVDCRVANNEHVDVSLWFNRNKNRTIDGERIKVVSKNVFNITNLQSSDKGRYYCKACGKVKTPLRINVKGGVPFATPEITVERPSSSVKYGSTITLECSVKGSYNDYEMLWFKVQPDGNIELKSTTRSVWSPDYEKKVQKEALIITDFGKENEGRYFCHVKRYAVGYVKRAYVQLHLEELFKPVIFISTHHGKLYGMEKEDYVVNYRVSGTPTPDIAWFKSVNGDNETLPITHCSGKTKTCSTIEEEDIEVTNQSFIIKKTSYLRHHNVTYICRAKNVEGKHEQKFTMFVKTKPRLTALNSKIQIHTKNLRLKCIISKDTNPVNMSYYWSYCDKKVRNAVSRSCRSESHWIPIESKENKVSIKIIENQENGIRLYRCIAENAINSQDQLVWTIVRPLGHIIPNSVCEDHVVAKLASEKEEKSGNNVEPIVIWQSMAAFLTILLLVTLLFTFRRRNPPKQCYSTCVVPVLKHKNGDGV